MSKGFSSVLFISDLHIPHHHEDSFHFLKAIKEKYVPNKIICSGDELDYASISYHEKNPDLNSPSMELVQSIVYLEELYKLFPTVTILESNHGSLPFRKAQTAGLPSRMLRSYNDVLNAPDTWNWVYDYTCKLSNGRLVYCHHGLSKNSLMNSRNKSMNYMQGHHHGTFDIQYWNNGNKQFWGMTAGCLIDPRHVAFSYGKNSLFKPILGCAIILDGQPKLIPMILDKHKRWNGRII